MRAPISIHNELPIRLNRFKLDPVKSKEFNNGDFARTDYKYLFVLVIDKGEGKTFIQVATPSFRQVLYSIWSLWKAYDGKPYDRHDHPVVMQAHDLEKVALESTNKDEKERKKVVTRFQRAYAKYKR